MEELIKKLQDKVGLSPEQAQSAFNTMIDFIQEKLPANLGINIDDVLNGKFDLSSLVSNFFGNNSSSEGGNNDNPLDKLKNMFS